MGHFSTLLQVLQLSQRVRVLEQQVKRWCSIVKRQLELATDQVRLSISYLADGLDTKCEIRRNFFRFWYIPCNFVDDYRIVLQHEVL